MRALHLLVISTVLLAQAGCTTLGYYAHVTGGQIALLAHRKPIARILADPHGDPALQARLTQARAARQFASTRLDLPRNRSYTSYVALDRPYVTWNVFATAEFSIEPELHCFPFAGCVAYLGFFDRARAGRAAARLQRAGEDTAVEGAAAYSTLGWFADPILSSMLRWDDDELDAVIFHELAHQQLYVKGDTAFNESWATFVQDEGLREWRAERGFPATDAGLAARRADAEFTRLVLDLRRRLGALYQRDLPARSMRAAKRAEIDGFRARYAQLRRNGLAGDSRRDAWVAAPINNAKLAPFGLYDAWVPAFAKLFAGSGRRWPTFHSCVRAIAHLARAQRDALLDRLVSSNAAETAQWPSACPVPGVDRPLRGHD